MQTIKQDVKETKTFRELRDILNCLSESQLNQPLSVDGSIEELLIVGVTISDDDIIKHPDGECIGTRCECVKHYPADELWMWEVLEPAGTVSIVVEVS